MKSSDALGSRFSPEERYRLLVEAVTDYAIYMLDPDGFVVSWNSGAQRLKGYTEQEIVGRHFSEFYLHEDAIAGVPAQALATARGEGRFDAEGWHVRKGGERFWAHVVIDPIVASDGELIGYAKVTRDLTERQAAEESLRRSETQFRLLVQGVTDYAIYMLDPNGMITNWNVGAQRIKGYQPDEVVGMHFSRFYREEDKAAGNPMAALQVAASEGRFESEGWRVRRDGTEFWASVIIDAIRGPDGEIIGFAKVTRDVTEKREARIALERTREALFQAQKLDAIGQLTGGVAHDFNNLLMVVISSLELLKRRIPENEKSKRLIDTAMRGAKRGVTLTKRMLAFARRQELQPVAVYLRDVVYGMKDLLERSLGSTISIVLDLPSELQPVLIDPNQFELAILNLAVNARDAMPDGGTLTIDTRLETVPDDVPGLRQGAYVRLRIADTGSGMNEATLARAMEPFYTTKGIGKGTGLGLPMVHGLAAQSGGQFVLRSTLGIGTTAELWLPVAAVGVDPAAPVAESSPSASGETLAVVAVDDDVLVLAITVAMLEDLGHTVVVATSAQQALVVALSQPTLDLVITDQVMPHMTGAELIAQLAVERPELPTILTTGFSETPELLAAMAIRLAKPFNQAELMDAISRAMAKRGREPADQ